MHNDNPFIIANLIVPTYFNMQHVFLTSVYLIIVDFFPTVMLPAI